MANRLGILKSEEIKALGEAGRSEREIAQVMGVSRGARPTPSMSRGAKRDQSAHRLHPGFGIGERQVAKPV